jgi:hypothetical protein
LGWRFWPVQVYNTFIINIEPIIKLFNMHVYILYNIQNAILCCNNQIGISAAMSTILLFLVYLLFSMQRYLFLNLKQII